MGDGIVTEWPEIDPEKWYKCTIDAYQDELGENDCTQAYIGTTSGCLLGATIQLWLDLDHECFRPFELLAFTGASAQRLKKLEGPFDDRDTCLLEL